MKTSNKILLSTLITVVLILTGIHVATYAKYKSGDFTSVTKNADMETLAIQPVKFVSITGMENVIIEPSDSFSMTKPRVMPANFSHTISGDTLFITGDTSTTDKNNHMQRERLFETVWLMAPVTGNVFAENSSIQLSGAKDSASAVNSRFNLSGSSLTVQQEFSPDHRYFGNLEINATNNSKVVLQDLQVTIASLSCTLVNSYFEDAITPQLKKLSIESDNQSVIKLNGTNLKKMQTGAGNKTPLTP